MSISGDYIIYNFIYYHVIEIKLHETEIEENCQMLLTAETEQTNNRKRVSLFDFHPRKDFMSFVSRNLC